MKRRAWIFVALLGSVLALAGDAGAIIGRPLTPGSFAGVARRTTRRAVYVGAAASSAAYYAPQPSTTVVQVQAPPQGCVPNVPCNGATYRPYYDGPNVVYVPQQ